MHPLVVLGLAGLGALGIWAGLSIPMLYGAIIIVVVTIWLWNVGNEIVQFISSLILIPILLGLFIGIIYTYTTKPIVDNLIKTEKIVETLETNETEFNLVEWLNSRPFGD